MEGSGGVGEEERGISCTGSSMSKSEKPWTRSKKKKKNTPLLL